MPNVILDACVLFPMYLRDTLLSTVEAGLYGHYSASRYYAIQFSPCPSFSIAFSFEDVPHSCRKCCIGHKKS
ncbi:MAG: hypothetical protein V7K50_04760 [Nostoc sp.]